MAKISDYSTALLPQEVIDFLDEIKNDWNFGKYQKPVVTSTPTWTGRLGEEAFVSGGTWACFVCTSDQTTRWAVKYTFTP